MTNIAFTGGGTGGHIYPGLAVAGALKERLDAAGLSHGIFWIGADKGMDREIVQRAGIEFHGVPAGKLRRYFSLKTIPDAFRVAAGFFAARRILKKRGARLLFSKGGFVSVPPCAAAASLGIPVLTHESDFSPGLASRINLRFARRRGGVFFMAYEETARFLAEADKGVARVAGNPVRRAFRRADPERGRAFLGLRPGERLLLILGGSQGAREVNDLARACLGALRERYVVAHQTGNAEGSAREPGYIPLPYIGEEMPDVLAAAEIVIGRSGAGTVWECATLGKPMILIPLSGSGTRGDQVENARFFEKAGAAIVFAGEQATAENLSRAVADLAGDPAARERMSAAAARIGSLDGAEIVSAEIEKILRKCAEESGGPRR
ncbi:MAG: undecaprenyldiphospho-muramoylpentapeptide beta-N-acetylglucosaminyltransferase [Treponema sp.]|nr:undecaprenyldiphospho-muramoylpentapeptide beta-N-acetylglucosaminyltransferase [Treponema sp.]